MSLYHFTWARFAQFYARRHARAALEIRQRERAELRAKVGLDPGRHIQTSPHDFERRGLRWWICDHCWAPRRLHPRRTWARNRPIGENGYLSPDAPHFREGW